MAIIGIDLGTTNSLVSVWKDGRIQLVPNSFGEYLTPSVVSFDDNGEVYVGKIAKERLITHPAVTFSEFKRNMGTDRMYYVGKRGYRAEELSSFVLRRLKEDAQNYLNEEVTEAVISVPAYFNDDKRCATKNAGTLAGLRVERLINEPSAVALKHHVNTDNDESFIIFDFGGGTLDVSLVEAFDQMVEIQAVAGDNYLGGKDFDEAIANYFYESNNTLKSMFTLEEQGIIKKEAEALKKELTHTNNATRTFWLEEKEYTISISNQELIHIASELFTRMSKPIKKVLNDADMTIEEIDKIILVGGSSKMPVVAKYIKSLLDVEVVIDDNPDESIAMGVGIASAIKERKGEIKDVILADICPFSLGTAIYDCTFSPIIQRNETLPCKRSKYYVTVNNNQTSFDFPIYQGENLVASENLLLGNMRVDGLPRAPKGAVGVEVTFMYDINGILDIRIQGSNQNLHKVILNKNMVLSKEELDRRLEELKKMTLHPLELEENKLLIEKAERLYQESNPQIREYIASMVRYFKELANTGKEREVHEQYVKLAVMLEAIERRNFDFDNFDESFWSEEDE